MSKLPPGLADKPQVWVDLGQQGYKFWITTPPKEQVGEVRAKYIRADLADPAELKRQRDELRTFVNRVANEFMTVEQLREHNGKDHLDGLETCYHNVQFEARELLTRCKESEKL